MDFQYITLEMRGGAAWITVNRPEVRNAMNNGCWAELAAHMDRVEADPEIKAAVITGAGDRAFISGADVNALREKTGPQNLHSLSRTALQKIEDCSKPVVAAINGHAMGGGLEVALACDLRIAVLRAKFAFPEVNLGIMPGAGGTQRLARIVGIGRAKEMILAGRTLTAAEAADMGLIMKVVEPDQLTAEAEALTKTLMSKAPLSLNLAKKMVNSALDVDRNSGLLLENLGFAVLLDTDDKLEGIDAFLDKRTPAFQSR